MAVNTLVGRYYPPEVLGQFSQIFALYALAAQLAAAGCQYSAVKFVAEAHGDVKREALVIVSGLAVTLVTGSVVRFRLDRAPGDAREVPLPHPEVVSNIMPGHTLMIDDGKLRLEATSCDSDYFDARVVVGGVLSDRKGVNLPDTDLPIPPLTEKDRIDLAFGLELGVDWVALSFVQRAADVIEAQGIIQGRAGIMAKIEKPAALDRMEDIVALVDSVMVARGDLGVEIPPEDVPGR